MGGGRFFKGEVEVGWHMESSIFGELCLDGSSPLVSWGLWVFWGRSLDGLVCIQPSWSLQPFLHSIVQACLPTSGPHQVVLQCIKTCDVTELIAIKQWEISVSEISFWIIYLFDLCLNSCISLNNTAKTAKYDLDPLGSPLIWFLKALPLQKVLSLEDYRLWRWTRQHT